jgi:hypothetical protein
MTPAADEEFVDLVQCLNDEACDFLIVGAHALAAHGTPRATGDLDVFVRADLDNAARVFRALARFGPPLSAHGVSVENFAASGTVYQIGLPPRRIDILTELSGITFQEGTVGAISAHLGGQPVRCIGLEALIRNKRAAGRAKDLADLEVLEELARRAPTGG